MKIKSILIFLISLFFVFFTEASAVTLDPNNPGGHPPPQTLKDAGITQVRIVLKNDEATKTYVSELKAAGINVIGIINWEYSPEAWTNSNQLSQNYINNFSTQIINDAYANFGLLYAYQVWNEPDGTQGGSVAIDPASYAHLLASVNSALDGLNASQVVLSAGFVSGDLEYLRQVIAAAGGTFPADGVALHAYNNPEDPASVNAIISMIQAMSNMTNKKVWITEFGWQTGDLAKQAAWLAQVYALRDNSATANLLQTVMWYAFSDAQNPGFGLFNVDGTPKPAFFVLLAILQGHPLSADALADLLAGILVACKNQSGALIGYGISQAYCDSLIECKDGSGKIIGYAPLGLCKIQEDIKNACGGPIDLDQVGFKAEMAQWGFTAKFNVKEIANEGDLYSVANYIKSNFVLETVGSYPHFNLEPFANQLVGSKVTGTQNVATRVEDFKAPTQLSSRVPGKVEPSGFSIGPQEYQNADENEEDYTKRVFTTSTSSLGNKEKYGERAEMKATNFKACIQRLACNPAVEDCLLESYSFESAKNGDCGNNFEDCKCKTGDEPIGCISFGKVFTLGGKLSFEEPADLLTVSKSLDNLGKKYSDIKDENSSYAKAKSQNNLLVNNVNYNAYIPQQAQAQTTKVKAADPQGALNGAITLGATPSGSGYNVNYRYCIWHQSPCGMGDLRSTINGTQINLWKSTTNDDPNNACLEPGWGGAPSFDNVSLPFTVTVTTGGNRTGPQGICPDSDTQSCTISEVNGVLSTTCGGTLLPPPPVDCRNCPSWAPASACEKIIAQTLPTVNECSDGKCESGVRDVEEKIPFNSGIDINFSFLGHPWAEALFNFLGLNKISCAKTGGEQCNFGGGSYPGACGPGCVPTPGYTCKTEPGISKWQCAFNASEYVLYAYPTSNLIGDYGSKTSYIRPLEAIFKIPGQTEKYFTKESAMSTVSLKLTAPPDSVSAGTAGEWDGPDPYYFKIKEGDTKKINVEYYDFYQPLYSSICLADQFSRVPNSSSLDYQSNCQSFPFYAGSRNGAPLDSLDPTTPITFSGNVENEIATAAGNNGVPAAVLKAILEVELGSVNFDPANYTCTRNSSKATGPMQITDGTVFSYISSEEEALWNIKRWADGDTGFVADGRCKIQYAMEIAARILKGKADYAVSQGWVTGSNEFMYNPQMAIYASGGYYGTRQCNPTAETENRWGTNISYCDFFIYKVGQYGGYPGQVCTTLNASCDGVGPFNAGEGAQSGPTQVTKVDPINSTPVTNPKGDTTLQKGFLIDVQNLMNKYKDQIKTDTQTIENLPPEMISEIKALAQKYKN